MTRKYTGNDATRGKELRASEALRVGMIIEHHCGIITLNIKYSGLSFKFSALTKILGDQNY